MASAIFATAQDDDHTITDGTGRTYLLPNPNAPIAPQTFTVGTSPNFGFALDVHGEQMNPPLGDVFKTDGPVDKTAYWRLFRGGAEYGHIFNAINSVDFNFNATQGNLGFHTNTIQRMRINRTVNTPVGYPSPFPGDRDGFLLLSGQPAAFTDPNSHAPFSRLHLVDNEGNAAPLVYAQEVGYRPWMRNGVTFTDNSDQGYVG